MHITRNGGTQVMCEVLVGGSVFGVALLAVVVTVLIVAAGRNGGHNKLLQFDDIFDPAFKPELVCNTQTRTPHIPFLGCFSPLFSFSPCTCIWCLTIFWGGG